ncbi:MAG: ATP-binding protein [Myxococcota bacterium]
MFQNIIRTGYIDRSMERPAEHKRRFKAETSETLRDRTRFISGFAIPFYGVFYFADLRYEPDASVFFLSVRAAAIGVFLISFASTYWDLGHRARVFFSAATPYASILSVSVIISQIGGFESAYYFGNLVALFAVGAAYPWSPLMTFGFGALSTATYFITVAVLVPRSSELAAAIEPVSFTMTTALFTTVSAYSSEHQRKRDLENRMRLERSEREAASAKKSEEIHRRSIQEAKNTQERMFTSLAHELRTPLTLTLSAIDSMDEPEPSQSMDHQIALIRSSALRQLHTVNQLLEISRADAGNLIRNQPLNVDMHTLINDLVSEFQTYATRLTLTVSLDGPRSISIDPVHLDRCLSNLISNATKFTPAGGDVHVTYSYARGKAQFIVEDNGPGIPPEDRDRVFERFVQADTSERLGGGSGLGLALVRQLTTLMGGTVWLESTVGEGARFTIELPADTCAVTEVHEPSERSFRYSKEAALEAGRPPARLPEILRITPSTLKVAPRVLLAEDNDELRQRFAEVLGRDLDVTAVADGALALELLSKSGFELLCTDVSMPRVDGIELVRRVRSSSAFSDLPIVVLSAHGELDDRVSAHSLGVDSYLVKPTPEVELTAKVHGLLRARLRLVEHFWVIEPLGDGGQGDVYVARDCRTGRLVALKVSNTQRLTEDVRSMQGEFEALRKIQHPGVVRVLECGEQNGHFYLATELVHGVPFSELLVDVGTLSIADTAYVGRAIAEALVAVHNAGLVHNDIKEANVIITGNDECYPLKLIDFGSSVDSAGLRSSGGGTLAYLAPERLEHGMVSTAADIYALGVVLYRTWVGRLPFETPDRVQLSEDILAGRFDREPLNALPDPLLQCLTSTLALEPEKRPSALEVADCLAQFASPGFISIPDHRADLERFEHLKRIAQLD